MSHQTTITIPFTDKCEVTLFVESIKYQLQAQGFDYDKINPHPSEMKLNNDSMIFRKIIYKTKQLEQTSAPILKLTPAEFEIVEDLMITQMHEKYFMNHSDKQGYQRFGNLCTQIKQAAEA